MFAAMSLMPEYYASKLSLFIALGPATRLKHTKSQFYRKTAEMLDFFKFIVIDTMHLYNFFEPNFYDTLIKLQITKLIPDYFKFEMRGFETDPDIIESGRMQTFYSHLPSGAGWRCFVHFAQLINADEFNRYNFGTTENYHHYNTTKAPAYPLSNIKGVPIGIFAGMEDELADVKDIAWLKDQLSEPLVEY